jgi:large subunit ribosomal protein L3
VAANAASAYSASSLDLSSFSLFGSPRPDVPLEKVEAALRAELASLLEEGVSAEEVEALELGQEITCDVFEPGQTVDVTGTSKGRGTAGVIKRHGFKIKKRTHGTHEAFRHGGSIGAGAWPAKVIKGMKMPGQMGNERVTVRNLQIAKIEPERNLLFVRGSVPGHRDAIICIREAVQRSK